MKGALQCAKYHKCILSYLLLRYSVWMKYRHNYQQNEKKRVGFHPQRMCTVYLLVKLTRYSYYGACQTIQNCDLKRDTFQSICN